MYYRCITCGLLLSDRMTRTGLCVGHKLKPAIRGAFWEWTLIKLGIYERIMLHYGKSE
jgi:hypothetical protein